jgi:energy-coupling factor transport system permease protein
MSLFLYSDHASFFHRRHPSAKIIGLLLCFVAALAFSHPLYLLLLVPVLVLPGLAAGVGTGLRRVGWLMATIGLMSFILWGIFYPGPAELHLFGPFRVGRSALLYGAGMAIRLNLMLFCGLVFLASTRVEEFTTGLTTLGVPYSVSFALGLSFRLVPIFTETAEIILEAQRSRGLDTEAGGPLRRIRTYLPLLVPVFASALRRTNQLAIALESKGFSAGRVRTSLREYRLGAADGIFLLCLTALAAGCVTIRWLGWGGV